MNYRKGIILAGGFGTRLHPLTKVVSKQLLPVYDKPMIMYPLKTLTDSGFDDLLVISNPEDEFLFKKLLEDYSVSELKISFSVQEQPRGIAEAFIIAEDWLDEEGCSLILGDNIFISKNINNSLIKATSIEKGATIFAYKVHDPSRYGVVEFEGRKVLSIEEKPKIPKSEWAVTGLYVYDNTVSQKAKELEPSRRGEIEITDLNRKYLEEGNLNIEFLEKDAHWLDAGTHDSLLEAGILVKSLID